MSSILRYRGGPVETQFYPIDPHFPVQGSDLVYLQPAGATVAVVDAYGVNHIPAAGCAIPVQFFPAQGTVAETQDAVQSCFLGVALQKVGLQNGEQSFLPPQTINPGWVEVALSGNFEFDCAANTSWTPNGLVAVAAFGTGTVGSTTVGADLSKQVASASATAMAIGVARPSLNMFAPDASANWQPAGAANVQTTPPALLGTSSIIVQIRSTAAWNAVEPRTSGTSGSGQ